MGGRQAAAGMPHLSSSHMRPTNISDIDLPGHDVGGCALNEALHCNAGASGALKRALEVCKSLTPRKARQACPSSRLVMVSTVSNSRRRRELYSEVDDRSCVCAPSHNRPKYKTGVDCDQGNALLLAELPPRLLRLSLQVACVHASEVHA